MVVLLANLNRISFFNNLLKKSDLSAQSIHNIQNDGPDWDEDMVKFVITKKPKLILFDNDFSPKDFDRLWLDVAKTIKNENLENTKVGIFHSDYCRHNLPKEEYVYIEKMNDVKKFT